MYLIGLLIVFGLLGAFALENGGTHTFRFIGYVLEVPTWAPTAAGVALVTLLLAFHMAHAGLRSGFRRLGYERAAGRHRGLIADLRAENARLHEALAAARRHHGPPARTAAPAGLAAPASATGLSGLAGLASTVRSRLAGS